MIDCPLNRLKVKRGEQLPQAKLTEADAKRIRRQYARYRMLRARLDARYTAKGLARTYNVHARTIEKILAGESWTHI